MKKSVKGTFLDSEVTYTLIEKKEVEVRLTLGTHQQGLYVLSNQEKITINSYPSWYQDF